MGNPATTDFVRLFFPVRPPVCLTGRAEGFRRFFAGFLGALTLAGLVGVVQIRPLAAATPSDASESTVPNLAPGNAEIDIDAFWRGIFTAAGYVYSTPAVVRFSAPISSGCGYVTPAELIAFYCAADVAVYWSAPSYDQAYVAGGDAAWVNVMAHEWSHHAQVLLGTNTPWRRANDIVSLELEATCMGGGYVASALDRGLVTEDMTATMVGMFVGSPYHGTTEQVQTAFLSGLHSGISTCGLGLPEPSAALAVTSAKAPDAAETSEPGDPTTPYPAQITVPALNLRATPSTSAPVRAVLTPATQLEVTGDAKFGNGYIWYPVIDLDTGLTGFVAASYLRL